MGKILIEVEFDGVRDNAYRVVDNLLDEGVIQDVIHEAAEDLGLKLKITHIMTKGAP